MGGTDRNTYATCLSFIPLMPDSYQQTEVQRMHPLQVWSNRSHSKRPADSGPICQTNNKCVVEQLHTPCHNAQGLSMLASLSAVYWAALEEAMLMRPHTSSQGLIVWLLDCAIIIVRCVRPLKVGLLKYSLMGLYLLRASVERPHIVVSCHIPHYHTQFNITKYHVKKDNVAHCTQSINTNVGTSKK